MPNKEIIKYESSCTQVELFYKAILLKQECLINNLKEIKKKD